MLCVTGVYLKDITNMIFVILHLHISRMYVREDVENTYTHSIFFIVIMELC